MPEQRSYAHGADHRIGEVMEWPSLVNSYTAWLRPAGGGREWKVRQADLVLCDRDGNPLPEDAP